MLNDYHIHTKRCKHAVGEMFEYVEHAIKSGISEIAFTDHIPLQDNFDLAHRMAYSELENYMQEIEKLRMKYPGIKIHAGIEADFIEGYEEYLYKTIKEFKFDITILSVHFVNGWPKNNWVFSYYFPEKSMQEIYSEYLNAVKKGVETGLFQIVGHLDLIKSPDHPVLDSNSEEIDILLKSIHKKNMAVELNTSGLRKDINEIYPSLEFIPHLNKEKIPITIGSDAHKPEQVGFYFNELESILKEYTEIRLASIENGKIKIPESVM